MGIIYKIINDINGKIYVGRDKHDNPKYMGSGKLLHLAFKKYGIENFRKETIETCENSLLDDREKFWIKELNSQDRKIGYNIADGGHNDFIMNDYVKSKISNTLKGKYIGENSFRYGIKLTKEHKDKFLQYVRNLKGKSFEEVYGKEKADILKRKISISKTGKKFSKIHCESISRAKKGVPLTDKQRKAISESLKGRVVTDETKTKLRESNLNKTQKHSIKIECKNMETGEIVIFNNVAQATRDMNCSRYDVMNNKLAGYIFSKLNTSNFISKKNDYIFYENDILVTVIKGKELAIDFCKTMGISCKIWIHKKWKKWRYEVNSNRRQ